MTRSVNGYAVDDPCPECHRTRVVFPGDPPTCSYCSAERSDLE